MIESAGGSGTDWDNSYGTDGGGNIDADPRFADPDGPDGIPGTLDDNLRVADTGPAYNAGDADLLPADSADLDRDGDVSEPLPVDYLGQPRVQNGGLTMGAYEGAADVPPLAPDTLRAAVAPDSTTLRWPAGSERDVNAYNVYRSAAPFDSVAAATRITASPVSDTAYVDTGVQAGTAYYYRVTAVDDAGQEGPGSPQVRTPEDRSPPDAPATLAATAYAGSASLTWSASDSTDTNFYRIYRDTDPLDASAGPSTSPVLDTVSVGDTTYTDGALTRGVTYHYRVTAVDDSSNESGFSPGATATPGTDLRVSQVRPASGAPGTPVRVYGAGFDSTAADHTVTFDATQVPVDSVGASVLYTRVPRGLRGPVGVSVRRASDGQTASVAAPFTVVSGGDSSFVASAAPLAGVEASASDWGDYDGDGDLDLVLAGDTTGSGDFATIIYRNDGGGSFTALNAGLPGVEHGDVAWGDYDDDGDLDLVVTGGAGAKAPVTKLYRNEGQGRFVAVGAGLRGVSESAAAWGDADGDGDLDLVVTGSDGGTRVASLYRNEGGGTFARAGESVVGTDHGALAWGDYNGDGRLDLAVTGDTSDFTGPATVIYRNEGNARFTPLDADVAGARTGSVAWGDYNADGKLDLLVAGDSTGSSTPATTIYRNEGSGRFAEAGATLGGISDGAAAWGDYDGDGRLDVAVVGDSSGSAASSAALYRNAGGGSFANVPSGLAGVQSGTVAWGDFDGNGTLDLIVSGNDGTGPVTTLYRNKSGDLVPPDPPSNLTANATPDSILLEWEASDSSDVARYALYRDTTPIDSVAGPGGVSVLDSTAAGDTTYVDTTVALGTTYYYRVAAVDAAGNESAFSPEAAATPRNRLYVDASNTPSGCATASSVGGLDGASWACAFPALQDAFDLANKNARNPYEIWVAAGTYYPDVDTVANDGVRDDSLGSDHRPDAPTEHFTLTRDSVSVYGGFSGGETARSDRDPATNVVTLSGDIDQNDDAFAPSTDTDGVDSTFAQTDHHKGENARHVIVLDGRSDETISSATVLDGVTVRAGRADASSNPGNIGGGLLCRGLGAGNACSPTLRNVRFVGNHARAGGAVFNEADSSGASSPTLVDVRFEGNAAVAAGGGVFNEAGGSGTASPTLTRPVFVNNTTGRLGGGMYNDAGDGADGATSSPALTEARFEKNTAGYRGGALYNDAFGGTARPTITKGTFTQNSAPVDSTRFPAPAGGGAIANGAVAGGTASPQISGATFSDNRAVSAQAFAGGGSIYTFSDSTDRSGTQSTSRLAVVNSSFTDNTASDVGGAVYSVAIRGGVMASDVRGATFAQNAADRGGAVHLESLRPGGGGGRSVDTTRIANTTFTGNQGRSRGGAVSIEGRKGGVSRQVLTTVAFAGNEAGAGGGALDVLGNGTSSDGTAGRAAPRLTEVRFRQNQAASGSGGALATRSTSGGTAAPTMVNSVFAGNAAAVDGGAVDNRSEGAGTASPTLVNVTFAGNAADESGGAVASRRNTSGTASPTLVNAILWHNTADADGDGSGSGRSVFVLDGSPDVRYSIVEGGCPAPVSCAGNLLNQAPQFAGKQDGAGPDSAFGTPDDDLRVQGTGSRNGASPAIDAGDNTALDLDGDGTAEVATALGGRDRRLEVPGVTDTGNGSAPIVDMGAFESTGAPLSTLQPPLALRAQATPDSVALRWSSPAAYAPDRYRIYRDTRAIGTAKRPSDYGPVDSTGGGTTAFVDPSVASDSAYYYRVTAVDTAGVESQFSNQVVAVTEAPLVSQSATVQSDGAVDFGNTGVNLSFTGVSGSGGVEVRKFGSGPAGAPGIAEANVSQYRYVISAGPGLQFDSTDVRLDVGTLSGVSDPSNVTVYTRSLPGSGSFAPLPTTYDSASNRLVVTTGSFSEFVLASDTDTLSTGGGDALRIPSLAARGTPSGPQVTLSWTAPSATDVQGYRVYRSNTSFSDTTNATRIPAGGLVTTNQFVDADVGRGTTYFYRVVAVESSGFSGPVSKEVRVTLPVAEFSASVNRQFGSVTDPQNYRLVSLPGAGSRSVSAVVSGEPGAQNQFRAFREEGGAEQGDSDLTECGVEVSDCSFTPGDGFWLLARDEWSTSNTFEAVSLSERGTFTTSLTAGWNLVSNPFAEALDWKEVQAANDGTLPAEVWTRARGSWEQVDELASAGSGRAYYINVPSNRSQLVLPHPTATDSVSATGDSTTQVSPRKRLARARDSARTVSLRAVVEGEERSTVRVGVSDAARSGLDALDLAAPPFPVPTVSLRALPDTGASAALLRAYRPLDGAGQRFPLRLRTGGEDMITLRPGPIDLGAKYDVVLVKAGVGQSYDLREDEKVVLQPDGASTRLVLLVGTASYIERQKSRLAPDKLRLLGNYPNPVSHSTTIEYGLPEEEHVRLALYDILGRRIQVLVDETQRAGFHRVQWGGADRSVASGVYFYRLRVGDKSRVKKMTVVR